VVELLEVDMYTETDTDATVFVSQYKNFVIKCW
jgi:hypothetical protein